MPSSLRTAAATAAAGRMPRYTVKSPTGVLQLSLGPRLDRPARLALDFFPLRAPGQSEVDWSDRRSVFVAGAFSALILHALRGRGTETLTPDGFRRVIVTPSSGSRVDFQYTDATTSIHVPVSGSDVAVLDCLLEVGCTSILCDTAP